MQFKIKNTTIKIHFTFFAVVLLFLVSGNFELFLVTSICAIIHEAVHIMFILLFSGRISEISLSLIGADIKRFSQYVISNTKEAMTCISAPLLNIALFLIFRNCDERFLLFSQVNFTLGFINLLPFYSFDGGCFVEYLLLTRFNEKKTDNILTVVSVITTVFASIFAILFSLHIKGIHPSAFFCLFMVLSLVFKK